MKKIQDEFVTYQQALEVRELGFDFYEMNYYPFKTSWDVDFGSTDFINMPLKQQIFDWFRNLGYHSFIEMYDNDTFDYVISSKKFVEEFDYNDGPFYTYEEAEIACVNSLILLLKKEKQIENS